jgi:nucleoid DNA-binding protein
MTLAQIIVDIARRYRVPTALAGGFVHEAIEELIRVVDSGKEVKVRGLGAFRWRRVKERPRTGAHAGTPIPAGWKLHFYPARNFRCRRTTMSDPTDTTMTKYGVELSDEKTKQASERGGKPGRCPVCSRVLDDAGACPEHGTEPLEPTRRQGR